MWRFARQLVRQAEDIIAPEFQENGPVYGFRVLHVDEASEARRAGIESLFDFIVGVNGNLLSDSRRHETEAAENAPVDELKNHLRPGEPNTLSVWSMKGKVIREVIVNAPASGLGLTVQWISLKTGDHVWHVLGVTAGSPADEAGLIANKDYIVGAENGFLEQGGESLLARVANRVASEENSNGFEVYVYNSDYETLRPVRIVPRFDPHGQRLLGCSVGYGYLHRLPAPEQPASSDPPPVPSGVDLSESFPPQDLSPDAFVPAAAPVFTPASANLDPPAVAPVPRTPHRARHTTHGGDQDLSAYFDEQTVKSHEIDGYRPQAASNLAPPPPAAH